jgi:hypothetical protein
MEWSMPTPPPPYVLSVRDGDGHEWKRAAEDGLLWHRNGSVESWDWLIYNRGVITADELAR